MTTHRSSIRFIAVAVLLALLSSCSRLPTEPAGSPGTPGAANTAATQGVGSAVTPGDAAPANLVVSAQLSTTVWGLLGGTVKAGDFTVIIPPGAISGVATVTVLQPDVTQKQVQLSISPASANHFRLPVLLVADCHDIAPALLSLQTIYWLNPQTQKWEAVPGARVDLLGLTVQAPLWHFSTYKVGGRAGW